MPVYDWMCATCGLVVEEFIKDSALRTIQMGCVACPGDEQMGICTFERQISAPHVVVEEHNRAFSRSRR